MNNEYLYDYDNPYRILAHYIVGFYRPAEVLRILADNNYLFSLVQKEVRGLDINGSFLDCVIEEILTNKKRMDYMRELDKLAKYYYDNIDKDRLRKEIIRALEDIGITIDVYPAAGNVSSAVT